VPWRPVIEKRMGQTLTATMARGVISWEFGRHRGPSVG
jgi:hypothetical protein